MQNSQSADDDRIRAALIATGQGVYELDLQTNRIEWSDRTRQIIGARPGLPATLEQVFETIHPDDREEVRHALATAADPNGRGEFVIAHRVVRADGDVRWIGARGRVTFEGEGPQRRAVRLIGTFVDITESGEFAQALRAARQEAERRLDEEHEWLTLALTAAQMGIWEWNFTTGERRWNSTMYDLYGVKPWELTRRAPPHIEEIVPEDAPRVQEVAQRLLSEGGSAQVEFRIRRRDNGEMRWVSSRGVMRNDQGQRRMLGVTYDITERKLAEQALQEADRRKDEFLATLSHELRNPLAPLRNALRLLRHAPLQTPFAAMLDVAERQTQRLARLVDDLLEMSRITQGRIDLKRVPTSLDAVITEAVETARPDIDARGQRLELELALDPAPLAIDPVRIGQVLENLLTNASKYSDDAATIWLRAREEPGAIVVQVCDQGIGMSADELQQVFQMFVQSPAARKRAAGGLGIGLALARRLVELHGGRIVAASDGPGRGSTFTVRLPREPRGS